MAPELVRESQVHFLQLNAVEVAIQLTLQDFSIFRQIESTEYVDDLFELKSRYGVPMLSQFAEVSGSLPVCIHNLPPFVRFEVFTALIMKDAAFRDVMPYNCC
jgi:hypothetical protein